MVASPCLKDPLVQRWLRDIGSLEAHLDEVTAFVHPSLRQAGQTALDRLKRDSNLGGYAKGWPSSFTGFEVIVNRTTPWHQDSGSSSQAYDLLLSLGYGHDARFEVSDLQASFDYKPGAAVYLSGRTLKHAVHRWKGGERISIAHFTKDAVRDRLGVLQPQLPKIQQYFL